ncbi:hypothetical protein ScPMuIL_012228 [Solemya velum]
MKNDDKGLDICVRNPMTHNTWGDGRYTTYEIAIETTNRAFSLPKSVTRRRYSEFMWLRSKLKDHHPLLTPPKLPPRNLFTNRFSPDFLAFRMKGLEKFLNDVLIERYYISDSTFHLFMQTDLSCKEIEDFLTGKLSEDYIQDLWRSGGKTETQSLGASSGNGLLSGNLSDSSFEELDFQDSLTSSEDMQTSPSPALSSGQYNSTSPQSEGMNKSHSQFYKTNAALERKLFDQATGSLQSHTREKHQRTGFPRSSCFWKLQFKW